MIKHLTLVKHFYMEDGETKSRLVTQDQNREYT